MFRLYDIIMHYVRHSRKPADRNVSLVRLRHRQRVPSWGTLGNERGRGEICQAPEKYHESLRIDLLDHPKLINQLCVPERRTARGGRDSIDHPPGAHDDIANAVAGVAIAAIIKYGNFDPTYAAFQPDFVDRDVVRR